MATARLSLLERRIMATLAYADQFRYPLSESEIFFRLLDLKVLNELESTQFKRVNGEREPGSQELLLALKNLLKKKRVIVCVERGVGGEAWYRLNVGEGRGALRQQRAQLAQAHWADVQQFVKVARWIPWIEAIAVTGSLAMENVTKGDDSDFMIVTQPGRLWLTRLAVTAIAVTFGKRRSWHHEEPNSWCFNLWLTSSHLAMAPSHQTVYGAHEVVQARWVYDQPTFALAPQELVEAHFYAQNRWILNFLPVIGGRLVTEGERVVEDVQRRSQQTLSQAFRLSVEWLLLMPFWDWLAYLFQRAYMQTHMTREKVSLGFAFFHPRDTRSQVESKWKKIYLLALKSSSKQK
jgi:hypothetical protein